MGSSGSKNLRKQQPLIVKQQFQYPCSRQYRTVGSSTAHTEPAIIAKQKSRTIQSAADFNNDFSEKTSECERQYEKLAEEHRKLQEEFLTLKRKYDDELARSNGDINKHTSNVTLKLQAAFSERRINEGSSTVMGNAGEMSEEILHVCKIHEEPSDKISVAEMEAKVDKYQTDEEQNPQIQIQEGKPQEETGEHRQQQQQEQHHQQQQLPNDSDEVLSREAIFSVEEIINEVNAMNSKDTLPLLIGRELQPSDGSGDNVNQDKSSKSSQCEDIEGKIETFENFESKDHEESEDKKNKNRPWEQQECSPSTSALNRVEERPSNDDQKHESDLCGENEDHKDEEASSGDTKEVHNLTVYQSQIEEKEKELQDYKIKVKLMGGELDRVLNENCKKEEELQKLRNEIITANSKAEEKIQTLKDEYAKTKFILLAKYEEDKKNINSIWEEKFTQTVNKYNQDLNIYKVRFANEKAALNERLQKFVTDLNLLEKKNRSLSGMFEDIHSRYESRESRSEDLERIADLEGQLILQAEELEKQKELLKAMKCTNQHQKQQQQEHQQEQLHEEEQQQEQHEQEQQLLQQQKLHQQQQQEEEEDEEGKPKDIVNNKNAGINKNSEISVCVESSSITISMDDEQNKNGRTANKKKSKKRRNRANYNGSSNNNANGNDSGNTKDNSAAQSDENCSKKNSSSPSSPHSANVSPTTTQKVTKTSHNMSATGRQEIVQKG